MNQPVRTTTADLRMSYSQFVVRDRDNNEAIDPALAASNGLVGTNSDGVVVLTGIHTGRIRLTIELLDTAPDTLDLDTWDEVIEVSVYSEDGELTARGIMQDPPPELPALSHQGPGPYRLRVHARGRDTATDLTRTDPVENYKISIWPAPEAPEAVHKQTDERGVGIRANWTQP